MSVLNLDGLHKTAGYFSESISPKLFGANFLFNRDGGTQAGSISQSYKEFAAEVDLPTMRYPGGTMTETLFDLANPDSPSQNFMGIDKSNGEPTVGLSTFLDFARDIGATVTIVLPTYRFLTSEVDETGHRQVDPEHEAELRTFVRFCLDQAASRGVDIDAFEIGNEWWVDSTTTFGFRMSPIEYGRVAAYIAEIVQEEIHNHNASAGADCQMDPAIAVQVGPGGAAEWYTPDGFPVPEDYCGEAVSATELIARQFEDPEARAAIDAVLTHRYLHGTDSLVTGWAYNTFHTWDAVTAELGGFKPADRYVTEWNVSARNQSERGLKQFDSMIELLREMAVSGADHANVWAVQQRNATRLIENTGLGSESYGDLSFAGIAFDMMSTQLPGLSVLATPRTASGLAVNAFGSEDRNVYFFTNRSDLSRQELLTLSTRNSNAHHITVYEVSAGPDGKPEVRVTTYNLKSGTNTIPLEFSPDETVMVVVAKGNAGTHIEGYGLADNLTGSSRNDTILGGAGADTIRGLTGADLLSGETGDDSIDGGAGDDSLYGGAGNDTLIGGMGADHLFGGEGHDTASWAGKSAAVQVDLENPGSNTGAAAKDRLKSIESLIGTGYDDRLFGDSGANALQGAAGNDLLVGRAGDDSLYGGAGHDTLLGGDGEDRLEGGAGNDRLEGGAGKNGLYGGNGNDTLFGAGFAETLDGGAGFDYANYEGAAVALVIDLADPSRNAGAAEGDVLVGIEAIIGTTLDDLIFGDEAANLFRGENGGDFLSGMGGKDSLYGGGGDDTLVGGAGADRLEGGAGLDIASYTNAATGVTANLAGSSGNTGDAKGDVYVGVEGLEGSAFGDRLFGNASSNTLFGLQGNDMLDGRAGNDSLYGGDGNDTLLGGAGDDRLSGDAGNDRLVGGAGNDWFSGGEENDSIFGGSGDDTLFGDAGDDLLEGGAGNDWLEGGAGNDILNGGAGADQFIFTSGHDIIQDFSDGIDKILIDSSHWNGATPTIDDLLARAFVTESGLSLDLGSAGVLEVRGIFDASLLVDDIHFV